MNKLISSILQFKLKYDLTAIRKSLRERVLDFKRPYEGPHGAFVTVLVDGGVYKMYYRGSAGAGLESHVVCYAESKDGINWTKPNLGIYEYKGSKENNIVFKGIHVLAHNFSPFIDTRAGIDPNQKYKAVAGLYRYTKMPVVKGLYGLASADGLHWKLVQDAPIIPRPKENAFDTQNVAFWSESESKYVCYFRIWPGTDTSKNNYLNGNRWIARATSDDFVHWSKPETMKIMHEGKEAPRFQLYTNQTSPYFRAKQIYVAMPARFMEKRQALTKEQAKQIKGNAYKDCSDLLLLTSRGGDTYDQTFLEAFLRPGIGYENWVTRTNYSALNVVQTGDSEMSFYVNQHYTQPSAHVCRYSMRLDGFTSVHAGFEDGRMVTKPLKFKGDNLYINYSTSAAGSVRVEVQDESGKAIEGFAGGTEIIGNEIERKVAWPGAEVSKLQGQAIRLCFYMKDADIYSFIFK